MMDEMKKSIEALQGAPTRVPIRETDPPVESSISLWVLVDGRLRARKPDGTIVEYAQVGSTATTPGGGTSTEPPPPPPYVPSTQEYKSGPDWTECYWKGGSQVYANAGGNLYYAMYTSTTGELKSMLHFPNLAASLAAGPAGTRIAEVWFRIRNIHTYSNAGGSLRLGVHNADAKPGSFSEAAEVGRIPVGKPSNDWYQLPNWVGEAARDNAIKGFTLNQNSTSRSLYGYATPDAEFRIVFVR